MAFVRMKGVEGLVFVPDRDETAKKYPCEDCFYCQWCSDNRCALCLTSKSCSRTRTDSELISSACKDKD